MSRFLLFLAFVAFTLTEVQSPRFGDEERRLFAPFVPLILGGAVLLLSPRLMRMPHAVVASPPVVWLLAYLGWVAATTVWSGNVAESAFALTILVLALLVGIGLSGLPTDLSMRAYVASAVVVSHSMPMVRRLCTMGAVLDRGQISVFDRIDDAISYHEYIMGVPDTVGD